MQTALKIVTGCCALVAVTMLTIVGSGSERSASEARFGDLSASQMAAIYGGLDTGTGCQLVQVQDCMLAPECVTSSTYGGNLGNNKGCPAQGKKYAGIPRQAWQAAQNKLTLSPGNMTCWNLMTCNTLQPQPAMAQDGQGGCMPFAGFWCQACSQGNAVAPPVNGQKADDSCPDCP